MIRFTTDQSDRLKIPYAEELKSSHAAKPNEYISYPQTGHGFTAAENGKIIPEIETVYGNNARPSAGEIYIVKDGAEELVGIYDRYDQRFYNIEELNSHD